MAMLQQRLRPDGTQHALALDNLAVEAPLSHAEIGRTCTGDVFLLSEGMDVVSADGVRVGCVKEARRSDMLVDRPWRRDVYVPFAAVQWMEPTAGNGWQRYAWSCTLARDRSAAGSRRCRHSKAMACPFAATSTARMACSLGD